MPHKLDMARKYGFEAVEIFFEDLEHIAMSKPGGSTFENQAQAAYEIRQMCSSRGLEIVCLQPFWQYDGLLDRREHQAKIEKMKRWIRLAEILQTDIIQIPASFLPPSEITSDFDTIVEDLREVADLGLGQTPPIRFAYESLCWSTYIDTWEACWSVVDAVNRPNFGICLDTFNIAGRVFADPATDSGRTPNAYEDMKASIQRLVHTIDVNKVFFLQVVDAERLQAPLIEGHEFYVPGQHARMSWSRNCRLFYGEKSGYLPVREVAEAVVHGLGFDGWVSMELFNRVMAYPEDHIPEELARRGADSWRRLVDDLSLGKGGGKRAGEVAEARL